MNHLPSVVRQNHLTHYWWYRDEITSEPFALVVRYDREGEKKKFHQYQLVNGEWTEGAATPLPIYGLHLLRDHHPDKNIFIFEGEKCAEAAYHLDLTALTSMMGSSNATNADWAFLARYREHSRFVLVPDHDEAGKRYMQAVYREICRVNPQAEIRICLLPCKEKGDDFIDWLKDQEGCPSEWDGFQPIDEPASLYLYQAFETAIAQYSIPANEYFNVVAHTKPVTFGPFEPIEESILSVKSCPVHTFPKEVEEWLDSLSQQMQVPVDDLAAPFLIYAGSVIGRMRGMRVRRGTDWIEFPNLWGMIIGRPSLMKSPAMKAARKPLTFLISVAKKLYEEACAQHAGQLETWKILKKAKEEQLKKGISKMLTDGFKVDLQKLGGIDIEPEPKTPTLKRYKTDDTTVEKLGELLIENPHGVLLFRDELAGLLYSFEKAGRENDRPFFLESWSGKEDFNIDRIGRGSLYVPALYLSIIGSIQPGPLAQYIRGAMQGGKGDDGFIQRFQLMVWPEENAEWRLVAPISLVHLEEKIKEIFLFLDQLAFDPNGEPVFIEFDLEAQAAFDNWQIQLENRLRKDDLPPHMEAHLAKYKKLVPALSLIFHYLHADSRGQSPDRIDITTLRGAILWAEYLESHAEKIYHSGMNMVQKSAKSLLRRIKNGDVKEPFSARDIYQGRHWSGLSNPMEVEEVLNFLFERNYLMQQMVKTSGRPSMKYWVHSDVYKTET